MPRAAADRASAPFIHTPQEAGRERVAGPGRVGNALDQRYGDGAARPQRDRLGAVLHHDQRREARSVTQEAILGGVGEQHVGRQPAQEPPERIDAVALEHSHARRVDTHSPPARPHGSYQVETRGRQRLDHDGVGG